MEHHHYSFRCELLAHSNDVRALSVMDNAIVSGSRDMSGKLWAEIRGNYESCATLKGHLKYISAICVLPRSENLPLGVILTGSHDHKILGFLPYTQEPFLTLEGHAGPVCCLYPSPKEEFVLSSSWDCSARIWDVFRKVCIYIIYGHTQTIWAVINDPFEYIVTGSADKLIKVFNAELDNIHTLAGHTDCVRGLAYSHGTIFLSCSNDGTIRTWDMKNGNCLTVLQITSNYIYSLKANFEKDLIVAGCEDNLLCIIYKGKQQNITVPAQSIWAVDILPNSDVVAGSSDGYIRIFTASVSRQASAKNLEAYQKQLSDKMARSYEKISCKGEFDGQLQFVMVLGTIKCFKWIHSDSKWLPLENIKKKEQGLKASKHVYEAKEYDFLFDIYVEDDLTSPFKLPFNIGEDPSLAVQSFISKHSLNTKFTGVLKDFLLRKSALQNLEAMETPEVANKMLKSFSIPETFVFFQKFEEETLKQRVDEYWIEQRNSKTSPLSIEFMKALTLPNERLDRMMIRNGVEEMLTCLKAWPESIVYPILDIARISLMRPKVNAHIFKHGYALTLFNSIKHYMQESCSHNNRMLVCRILCNMFSSEQGVDFVFDNKEFILSHLPMSTFSEKHKGFEVAFTTLLLNLSIESIKREDIITIDACFDISEAALMSIQEEEAVFRLLVVIGTLALSLEKKVYPSRLFDKLKSISSWKKRNDESSKKAARCASFLISQYVSLVLESDSRIQD